MEQTNDIAAFSEKIDRIRVSISKVIVGQDKAVDLILTCLLADGHVLIEGVPGVAKTRLARLVASLIGARFSRIQFTPDLMPSDILGTTVFNMKTQEFDFHEGPAFADIVLADEINRAPAKTQSALFEVMQERQVTIDGITHSMDDIYTVIATQNPIEQEGTYRLPEAQLDRFLMKVTMGYPERNEEIEVLRRHTNQTTEDVPSPVITNEELRQMREMVPSIHIDDSLLGYITDIAGMTRTSRAVYLGASPRASIGILMASKATALMSGRDFVTPEDIQTVTPYVLQHRLLLTAEAEMEGLTPFKVATKLMDRVEVPK